MKTWNKSGKQLTKIRNQLVTRMNFGAENKRWTSLKCTRYHRPVEKVRINFYYWVFKVQLFEGAAPTCFRKVSSPNSSFFAKASDNDWKEEEKQIERHRKFIRVSLWWTRSAMSSESFHEIKKFNADLKFKIFLFIFFSALLKFGSVSRVYRTQTHFFNFDMKPDADSDEISQQWNDDVSEKCL